MAEFASFYSKPYRTPENEENDNQPDVLTDEILENQHDHSCRQLPSTIQLMKRKEMMKCRKVKAVVRFYTPKRTLEPEKYFHHFLLLYFPWRNESDLIGNDGTYQSKLEDAVVKETVQNNQRSFEPFADTVEEAPEYVKKNPHYDLYGERFDAFSEQENSEDRLHFERNDDEEVNDVMDESDISLDILLNETVAVTGSIAVSASFQVNEVEDDEFLETIRSLNSIQRNAFEVILKWCRDKVESFASMEPFPVELIYYFISGGAGTGKSHLIKAVYQTIVKTFKQGADNPDVPKVLPLAPTGVAAINISGTVINSALAIPINIFGDSIGSLPHEKMKNLRNKLSNLKLIIIDEVSMVSNLKLKHPHERLNQIFGIPDDVLFAGLGVIVFGDFYQLPPIKGQPVFSPFKSNILNLSHPWESFRMTELVELMRQQGDKSFGELLGRVRVGKPNDNDLNILKTRVIERTDDSYPHDALHIYAENAPVDEHNKTKFNEINKPEVLLTAYDEYPAKAPQHTINEIPMKSRSDTGGLDYRINVKEGARVMLTANLDVGDKWTNGYYKKN